MYTVVLTCVAVVVDKTTSFCCWEINKPGGATVHHSVNVNFEVKGMLADCLTSSYSGLTLGICIWRITDQRITNWRIT